MIRLTSVVCLFIVSLAPAAAQDKKPATLKLLVPGGDVLIELKINGDKADDLVTAMEDGVRVVTIPGLEAEKAKSLKVETTIIPNNYTKIFRTREVSLKAGESFTLDIRNEDKKLPDRIEVRWVPTPDQIVDKMAELAKVTKDDVIHDYGCGDAVMLIRPVKQFGAKKGFGNDIDPKMVAKAQANVKAAGLQDKISVVQGDILKMTDKDCGEATVVLLYIGDDLGAKLSPILQKSLKPGARIVSHRFGLGDWKPDKTITVLDDQGLDYTLHLWIVPEKK